MDGGFAAGRIDLGLELVFSPEQDGVTLDIVFVHGLRGHRTKTWTNSGNIYWLPWLRTSLPSARVWTYGYNANLWVDNSQEHITQHALRFLDAQCQKGVGRKHTGSECMVLYVGHSLGGILIKAAMIECNVKGANYSYLCAVASGIIFLGTPHRGSSWANRAYLAELWSPNLFRSSSAFIDLLRTRKTSALMSIADRFNNIWGSRPILSLRETKGRNWVGIIVRLDSATTNCSGEIIEDVPKDHHDISRPMSMTDPVYTKLVSFARNLSAIGSSEAQRISPEIVSSAAIGFVGPESGRTPSMLSGLSPAISHHEASIYPSVLRYFKRYAIDGTDSGWTVIDNFDLPPDSLSRFSGAVFMAQYPGDPSTTLYLTVPSRKGNNRADWVILSPNSTFYPGIHEGHFIFQQDFPFKPPCFYWDSPILSAYPREGRFSADFRNMYSPQPRIGCLLAVIENLAALIVLGPDGMPAADAPASLPPISIGLHTLPKIGEKAFALGVVLQSREDWMLQCTNFFSRAFNRIDQDGIDNAMDSGDLFPSPNEPITSAHRDISCSAIKAFTDNVLPHFEVMRKVEVDGQAPYEYFQNISTVKEWSIAERAWADLLNGILYGLVKQDEGRSSSYYHC